MNASTIKTVIALIVSIVLMVSGLVACSEKSEDCVDTFGLPKYEDAICEVVEKNEFHLLNTTKKDFIAYVDLIKQEGYTYYYEGDNCSEETALSMDFWQGKKEEVVVTVSLMVDLKTNTNYISVTKDNERIIIMR